LREITPRLHPELADEIFEFWEELKWSAPKDIPFLWPDQMLDHYSDSLYALLVYLLRRSDQMATAEVSTKSEFEAPAMKVSTNML
jgi:hypothetical protein